MFEDLTVPLCGFYDIRHTKSSLKKHKIHIYQAWLSFSIDDFSHAKYEHLRLSSKAPLAHLPFFLYSQVLPS